LANTKPVRTNSQAAVAPKPNPAIRQLLAVAAETQRNTILGFVDTVYRTRLPSVRRGARLE